MNNRIMRKILTMEISVYVKPRLGRKFEDQS